MEAVKLQLRTESEESLERIVKRAVRVINPPQQLHEQVELQTQSGILAKQMACSLLQIRKSRGLTQSAMAKKLGLSLGQWKKYESGAEVLRSDTAIRWCLNTGVSFYRLFCDSAYRAHYPRELCNKSLDKVSDVICTLDTQDFVTLVETISKTFSINAPSLNLKLDISPELFEEAEQNLENDFYMYVGRGLKRYRTENGYTQEAFANMLSVSMSSYQQYEKESSSPRFGVNILANFAYLSGWNPRELFEGSALGELMTAYEHRIAVFKSLFDQLAVKDAQEFEAVFAYCLKRH